MTYRVYVKDATREEIESTFDYGCYESLSWNEEEQAWQVDGTYSNLYAWLCVGEDDAPYQLPHAKFSELFEVGVDEPEELCYSSESRW